MQTNEISVTDILSNLDLPNAMIEKYSLQQTNSDVPFSDHTYCVNSHHNKSAKSSDEPDPESVSTSVSLTTSPVNQQVIINLANLTLENTDNSKALEVSMVLDNTFEALQSMYPSVIGINDADSSMMASIENNYPPGINTGNVERQSDHDTSGINNTKTVSVDTGSHSQGMQNLFSSSDFEGFHSSDILSDALNTNSHPSGHTPSITESYDGGENTTDSEDTIPATDNISVNTTLPSNFFLTKQINEQYAPDVISLWKSDAMREKMVSADIKP